MLLTTSEAAAHYSAVTGKPCSRKTVLGWLGAGKLRGTKRGRDWMIDSAVLERFAAIPRPAHRPLKPDASPRSIRDREKKRRIID